MTAVDVLARDRTKILVMSVLVDILANQLPADLVVEFTHLLFNFALYRHKGS
jgi:hypothetical protein